MKTQYCHFCGSHDHCCRDCPLEKRVAPKLKKIIGKKMERFVSDNLSCPSCGCRTLRLLDDIHLRLILFVTSTCLKKFELNQSV